MSATTRVTFTTETTTEDGETYTADQTAAVDSPEARELIYTGRARLADTKSKTAKSQTGDEEDQVKDTANG